MNTLIILITYVITSFMQLSFTCTLKSTNGSNIENAIVKEKNTTNEAVSDLNGRFTLKPSSKEAILVIYKDGFETLEIKARETADVIYLQSKKRN
jgi:hypothetical protein